MTALLSAFEMKAIFTAKKPKKPRRRSHPGRNNKPPSLFFTNKTVPAPWIIGSQDSGEVNYYQECTQAFLLRQVRLNALCNVLFDVIVEERVVSAMEAFRAKYLFQKLRYCIEVEFAM